MRAIIQRVSSAMVTVDEEVVGKINKGLLIFLGIGVHDNNTDLHWIINKITSLRIFGDENQKMNLSINEVSGSILVISQFTLLASTKKGNRPSFINAARPEMAQGMYNNFCELLGSKISNVQKGIFGADMKISLINEGPVTIQLDSKNKE